MVLRLARLLVPATAATVALTFAGPAAALQQPDGTVIPQGTELRGFLDAEGETIDPLTDAAITPQTFTPQCSLTFTVLARGGGQRNSFGWYNVTGTKPTLDQLFEFITCSDDVGTVKTLDVRSDPRYTGGEIGFFQATTEGKIPPNCFDPGNPGGTLGFVFYSEPQYNDDNTGPDSYIHLLIMNTTVPALGDAFYFGWEDLNTGGDNDFEDLLMRVEGIQCAGGGERCDTGGVGKCAFGATECVNGEVICTQLEQPTTETCNAVDDDCNGETDEGELCPVGEVCDRGRCREACGAGEFACPPGLVCENDLCIDPDCVGVDCPAEQICQAGTCVAACDGVTCPHDQICRAGACVDPCEGVQCGSDYRCEPTLGVCVLRCGCTGCPDTEACSQTTNACVESSCETVTCDAGTHCVGGTCVDDCDGAVCPAGQKCEAGGCVPDENATGGTGGANSSGGSGPVIGIGGGPSNGGTSSATGGTGTATGGTSAGNGGSGFLAPDSSSTKSDSGCGCRVEDRSSGAPLAVLALGALFGLTRRRKHR